MTLRQFHPLTSTAFYQNFRIYQKILVRVISGYYNIIIIVTKPIYFIIKGSLIGEHERRFRIVFNTIKSHNIENYHISQEEVRLYPIMLTVRR